MKKYVALLAALMLFFACSLAVSQAEGNTGLVEEDVTENGEAFAASTDLQEESEQEQRIEVRRVSEIVENEPETETEEEEASDTTAVPETESIATGTDLGTYNYNELVVGLTSPTTGKYFTDAFSNVAGDNLIRNLIEGSNLTYFDKTTGNYALNPMVVSGSVITMDEFGNKTYILFLNRDLKYSNGSKITAYDYAFSWLLQLSPEFRAIGAAPRLGEAIYGYEGYAGGITPYLTGVHVLTENVLSVTIRAEMLPYTYEVGLLSCVPYPISVIAPGCKVYESSVGVYIHNLDRTLIDRQFSADLLKETILDEEKGYAGHPSVSSGAYAFAEIEEDDIKLVMNQYYAGTPDGVKPSIPRIVLRSVQADNAIEQLEKRNIGLLPMMSRADIIADGIHRFENDDAYSYISYKRNGFSFISFISGKKGLDSENVRKAIALCLDKTAVSEGYVGEYGSRADGFYGNGQWMTQVIRGETSIQLDETASDYETVRAAWDALNLDGVETYNLDVEKAIEYLERDGWVVGVDGIRRKTVEGEELVLDLVLAYPEGNAIEDLLEKHFVENLAKAGIRLNLVGLPMDQILNIYHTADNLGADMVYLARNFNDMFDLTMAFESTDMLEHRLKGTCVMDEELYSRAVDVSSVPAENPLAYMQAWIAFQERFMDILPMIPVYSNTYYDFHTSLLHDYNADVSGSIAECIVRSYLSDYAKEIPVSDETDLNAEQNP